MTDFTILGRRFATLADRLGCNYHGSYRFFINRFAPPIDRATALLKQHRFFLILGAGRSGTTWLADLLNRDPKALVVHEPVPAEFEIHGQTLMAPETAKPYLRQFRMREMALRCRHHRPGIYGEVNPLLLFHARAFLELLPEMTILHLVRDGRDVVRSGMNTVFFSDRDIRRIAPSPECISAAAWQTMSRFEKMCWMWSHENGFLRPLARATIRLEDILRDYGYLKERVLAPLGLSVSEAHWQAAVGRPRNTAKKAAFGSWPNWTHRQREQFDRFCSREMELCGYGWDDGDS